MQFFSPPYGTSVRRWMHQTNKTNNLLYINLIYVLLTLPQPHLSLCQLAMITDRFLAHSHVKSHDKNLFASHQRSDKVRRYWELAKKSLQRCNSFRPSLGEFPLVRKPLKAPQLISKRLIRRYLICHLIRLPSDLMRPKKDGVVLWKRTSCQEKKPIKVKWMPRALMRM